MDDQFVAAVEDQQNKLENGSVGIEAEDQLTGGSPSSRYLSSTRWLAACSASSSLMPWLLAAAWTPRLMKRADIGAQLHGLPRKG